MSHTHNNNNHNNNNDDRLMRLEELVLHQERMLHDLNTVIVEMRDEFDQLRTRYQARLEQVESQLASHQEPFDPDERPPHY